MTTPRQQLFETVADHIGHLQVAGIPFIGIDGVDGSGKSVFGDELTEVLRHCGQTVIRASVDSFHNPRAVRYRRGRRSPEGFFHDSFNYAGLKEALLDPLREGRPFRTAIHDLASDLPVAEPGQQASPGSVLVFDGIFLHRPELREYWDLSVFLHVDFSVSVGRCAARDGTSPEVEAAANRRYVEGQRFYLRECGPHRYATLTIDNNDLATPRIVEVRKPGGTVRP